MLFALALVFAPALPVRAQTPQSGAETRAEALRKEREAKRQQLVPQEVNSIERRMLAMEDPEARNVMDANLT
jgi:hypothetical protein